MAPLTASNIPASVSPSFMLETSIPTIGVLAGFGFSFTRLVVGKKCSRHSVVEYWVVFVFGKGGCRCCFLLRERTLSSINCWGSCKFSLGSGKLYFGVVVIGYCAFTKIHQHLCVWRSWYLNIVHEQYAQYNKQQVDSYD